MLTLDKVLSISKPGGGLPIQIPLKATISYESFSQVTDDEKTDIYRLTEEIDLVQEEFWQAYLKSEQEWEEVYRRLAES